MYAKKKSSCVILSIVIHRVSLINQIYQGAAAKRRGDSFDWLMTRRKLLDNYDTACHFLLLF